MFTLLIPRKTTNGKSEKEIAYNVKELYFISRYNNTDGKLTYQTFFKDINKYAKNGNFDKIPKDEKGNLILPKKGTLENWPVNYDWENDYKIYEEFMNGTAQTDFQMMYIKNMRKVGIPLIEIKTNIVQAIHQISKLPLSVLLEKTYKLAKLGEFLKLLNDMIQSDITFGKEESTESDQFEYVETVDLESEEFMETELDYLIQMVEKT